MEPQAIIIDFHNAVARDLLIYMAFVGAVVAGTVIAAFVFGGRTLWSFTIVVALMGGGLAIAAQRYHASIPDRIVEDISAFAANPETTANVFEAKYSQAEAGARFIRLAAIWGSLITIGILAAYFLPRPTVRGITLAIVLLSGSTLVLDISAFRRDLSYSAQWSQM